MSTLEDKHIGVARVYCRSVLALAEEAGQTDELLSELGEIAGLMERDATFADFLRSPLIDPDERAASLEKLFRGRASDTLVDTIQVMNKKGRLEILPTLVELFRREHQDLRGKVDVHVTTAVPLKFKLREKLKQALAEWLGKQAEITEAVDESLIGGIVVRVGDMKLDASVKHRVDDLRQVFHDRASREIHLSRAVIED